MNIEQKSEDSVEQSVESKKDSKGDWVAQLEQITKIIERLIWMIVLVIIVAAVANFLKAQSPSFNGLPPIVEKLPIERPIPVQVDQEVALALKEARVETENFASAQLDLWKADVMKRVDDNFLDWYFGYFNQQVLAAKYLLQGSYHWFNSSARTPEESLTSKIQKEFERRVLPPEIAQASLNELIGDSVNRYTQELSMRIDAIPSRYKIPQGQWDKYLKNLALITNRSEGNREISLAEKGTSATVGVGSAYIFAFKGAKGVAEIAAKASTVAAEAAAKGGAKLAAEGVAKGTTKLGAKLLGKTLGSALGIGIIAWDLWDHHHTRATQLPILRQNIEQYLDQVKASILKDPTTGLISVIYDLEEQVLKASKGYRGA